jgi:hypothetical protein
MVWSRPLLAFFTPLVLALAACSNGGGGQTASTTSADVDASFPSGLAVGSPTDVSGSASALMKPRGGLRFARDWGTATWQAIRQGNGRQLAQLAAAALPLGSAHAAGVSGPEISRIATLVRAVLGGDTSVDVSSLLVVQHLFDGDGSNASCFGPQLLYANHDDHVSGPGASSQLPSGDLGLWKATADDGATPCVADQLSRRVRGVRRQTFQGLLLMAAMRHAVASDATLAMPAAGATTTVTAAMNTLMGAMSPAITVETATIALDSTDSLYTYRLVLNNGDSGLNYRRGEVILRHAPGSSTSLYSGVMQVAGFTLTSDAAMGCSDLTSGGLYQAAAVSTLSYSRNASDIAFSSRFARYCGHPTDDTASNYGTQVASFTSGGELDPSVKLAGGGGSARGSTLGWNGGFARFAGAFDRDTLDGSYQYAWQAGVNDGNSRTLLATSSYNSAAAVRTVAGYFGYAADIATTDGTLLGMICNWAGPGNNHTPNNRFQMQSATLADSASAFVLGSSKITYAPTVSCNSSSTMTYDVDGDHTIASGEGASVTNDLDTLTGSRTTVQEEISARGFITPAGF